MQEILFSSCFIAENESKVILLFFSVFLGKLTFRIQHIYSKDISIICATCQMIILRYSRHFQTVFSYAWSISPPFRFYFDKFSYCCFKHLFKMYFLVSLRLIKMYADVTQYHAAIRKIPRRTFRNHKGNDFFGIACTNEWAYTVERKQSNRKDKMRKVQLNIFKLNMWNEVYQWYFVCCINIKTPVTVT